MSDVYTSSDVVSAIMTGDSNRAKEGILSILGQKSMDELEVRKAEIEQQIMNHLDNYSGDPKWTNFTDDQKDDHYTILTEIL